MEKKTLKCTHCGKEFEVDESSYNDLLNQVRNKEFNKELEKKDLENKRFLDETAKRIKLEEESKFNKQENIYKEKIIELNNRISNLDKDNKINLDKSLYTLKEEITNLKAQLKNEQLQVKIKVNDETNKYINIINEKDKNISELNNKVVSIKKDYELESRRKESLHKVEVENLKADVERWKSFRLGDSTKDLGESLEQYCSDSFEEIHNTAYPRATFGKDNDSSEGSKGDFIFKDYAEDGIELCSIMFEMKTEKDTTATKHKNEDFFAKLDKDRTIKGCEYAVLVTTLEADSMLYNKGIVDVSHKFKRMFVVRPQHFLTIISLIRSMAINSYQYKKQVTIYQNEHLDITTFEDQVKAVAQKISSDYKFAEDNYNKVDEMCDSIIKKINTFRESFRLAYRHIGMAQNKLEDLSIRKLTKNNPTMKEKFENLAKEEKKND